MSTITTQLQLYNLALLRLGESPLASIGSDTRSTALNNAYAPTRQSLYREFAFRHSQFRATLVEDGTTGGNGWAHIFTLPAGYLRPLAVNPDYRGVGQDLFSVEIVSGTTLVIATDATTAILLYVKDDETFENWEALFVEALALRMALRTCKLITGSSEREQMLLTEFEKLVLPKASTVDASELEEPLQWHYRQSQTARQRTHSNLG